MRSGHPTRFRRADDDPHDQSGPRAPSGVRCWWPGKSFAELEAAMMKEGPLPEWLTIPIGAGVVVSGDSSIVTANLTPGNYLILCFIPSPDGKPHVMKV